MDHFFRMKMATLGWLAGSDSASCLYKEPCKLF